MTGIEIALCIAGAIVFIISFFIPQSKEKAVEIDKKESEDAVKAIVDEQLKEARHKITEVIDETANYTIEKTERSLERVSTEKIDAVSEYADTVIEDINKNHQEVMFLYDMLNNKHNNLKDTVAEVNQTTRAAKQTVKELEDTTKSVASEPWFMPEEDEVKEEFRALVVPEKIDELEAPIISGIELAKQFSSSVEEISFEGGRDLKNSNERILELRQQGKSNKIIAKELGLGIGEVKLVVDLYEGVSS